MGATGNEIKAALPLEPGVQPSGSELITAINYAIRAAFPNIKRRVREESFTFQSGTIDYVVTTSYPVPNTGLLDIFVINDIGEEERIIHWRQYYDYSGNLHVSFPMQVTHMFAGKKAIIQYFTPLPAISSLSDDTGLPLDYAVNMVCYWAAVKAATTAPSGKGNEWAALAQMYHEVARTSLARNTVLPDPQRHVVSRMFTAKESGG